MVRGQTRGPGTYVRTPRAGVAPCPAGCGGGTLPRAQVPHLSSAQGWPRPSPGPGTAPAGRPRCGTPAGPYRPGPSAAPLRRPGGRGRSPPRGGARGGARGVPSGPASGLCLPAPRAPQTQRPTGRLCVPPPLSPARPGPAHLGSSPPPPALCAPGSAWLGSVRSGSALRGRSRPGFGSRAAAPRAPR